jgi:hypothetical protein
VPIPLKRLETGRCPAGMSSIGAPVRRRRRFAMRKTLPSILTIGLFFLSPSARAQINACDLVSPFGTIDAADVYAAIKMSLGIMPCPSTINIAGVGVCNAIVVQRVTNAALGGPCVTPTTHGVSLAWAANTSSNAAGYNVYRATASGGPYTKVNASLVTAITYADNAVQAGLTYFYVVTAVDSSNNESAYSTQVTATIPNP